MKFYNLKCTPIYTLLRNFAHYFYLSTRGSTVPSKIGTLRILHYHAPLAQPPAGSLILRYADDAVLFAPKDIDCKKHYKNPHGRPADLVTCSFNYHAQF